MNKTSIPKLKSVKFKSGGSITVLPDGKDVNRNRVESSIRECLDVHPPDYAGFALVVWSSDGTSTASMGSYETSNIPSILVPDFVRNRLLAQRIETWTIEEINSQ